MPPPRSPVQPLEDRRLFASVAAIALANKVLTITASTPVSSTITVGLSADGTAVDATVAWTAGQGAKAVPHSISRAFPLAAGNLGTVVIYGSNKADLITVDQTHGSFPLPTSIHAGAGNDTITCGDEPDVVWGQGGNDLINGGGGNDTLYGQAGRDTLIGGAGDDYLSGGQGRDSLEGDDGNDTLYDPFGPDTILGGAGDNTFAISSLRHDPVNDYNDTKDTLHIIPVPTAPGADDGNSVGDWVGKILPFL